jgi:hypothetical protein
MERFVIVEDGSGLGDGVSMREPPACNGVDLGRYGFYRRRSDV